MWSCHCWICNCCTRCALAKTISVAGVSPGNTRFLLQPCIYRLAGHASSFSVIISSRARQADIEVHPCTRAQVKTEGGKIIRVEAHPIPEHPRPRRAQNRVALVGDAAGYVTKCSGEGIYFAAKSGRMCAEAIVAGSKNGARASITLLPPLLLPGTLN